MATLKVKKVKGCKYFYWSKSVRSHKKCGGDGRVKTVDYLIGNHPIGNWLAYRLWTGEAQLTEYAEAVIQWVCPDTWENIIKVSIDWKRQRVSIKSSVSILADCRLRVWKRQRKALQSWLDRIIEVSTQIDQLTKNVGYLLGEYYRCCKAVEELRQMAHEARLHPDRFAANAEEVLDQHAHTNQRRADRAMEYYLKIVEQLEEFAPPSRRQQFRHQVFSNAEKLAQDKRWLEEYQAKFERS